jgi:Fe(3+) dicitrate transport protein
MRFVLLSLLFAVTVNLFNAQTTDDTLKYKEMNVITIMGPNSKLLPGSGMIINELTLAKINQPDINKVLRIIPGVNIRDEEGFGLRPNIGLRGTPVNRSAKITLMEDGVLIAPAPYADPSAYYFPTFARMQGVEVLKGSSQIKYGPYTIGGAVNLLSTAIPYSFKGLIQGGYGSFGTNQQHIWIGDSHKQFDYVFEVNRMASNGFKQLDGGGNTGFDRRDFMGKVRWHSLVEAKIQQSVTFKFVRSEEIANETYLGLTFEDFMENPLRRYSGTQKDILNMNHSLFTLSHAISFTSSLKVNTTAYLGHTFRDWARANSFGGQSINAILSDPNTNSVGYGIMTGRTDGDITYRSAARTYYSSGIQSQLTKDFRCGKLRNLNHRIQVGGRYHEDQADRYGTQSTYSMTNGIMVMKTAGINGNQENQIRNAKSASGYINYEIGLKKFKLSPGLRYEYIEMEFQNYGTADYSRIGTNLEKGENFLSVWIPGATLFYEINKKMNTFLGAHKGFSPPGMPSVNSTSGQAMEETAINYELGYHFNGDKLSIQAVGFYSDFANILGSDNISGGGAGSGDMFNAGRALIQGFEFSMDYNFKPDATNLTFPIRVTYTYTNARFKETFVNGGGDWGSGQINSNDLIPFITPHQGMFSLGIENNKFNVIVSCRYVGLTRTNPGKDESIIPESNENFAQVNSIAAYTIFDLSANYYINKMWTLYSTINNFTNNQSIVANLPQGYRPAMPIAINLGVKVNL